MTSFKRRTDLDALRGFAILYIVGFWHLRGYSDALSFLKTPATLFLTRLVLGLFTFVSGYLMAAQYTFSDGSQVLAFYRRRFVRIYPLYLAALSGFLALGLVELQSVIPAALLVNTLLDVHVMTLWFVSMLAILYLLTPVYLYRFSLARTALLTGALWAVLVIVHETTDLVDPRLPQYLVSFVAGIVLAHRPRWEKRVQSGSALVACALILGVTFMLFDRKENPLQIALVDGAILASIPLCLALGQTLAGWMPQQALSALSYAGFVTYLVHRMTFELGVRLYQPAGLAGSILYLGGIVLPLTFLAGFGIQKGYDRVIQRTRLPGRPAERASGVQALETDV